MQEAILKNNKIKEERIRLYKSFGYDQEAARDFIVDKILPVEGKVLEVGTGKGHTAVLLAKKAGYVISVDISAEEQQIAKLNAASEDVSHKTGFVVCDAEKLPYKDRSFDTVVSVNAFHHFKRPFAVLSEMIRVCDKKLAIADFNDEGFRIIRRVHKSEGHEHQEECGDFSIVGAYLKEHGFIVKKHEGCCQLVYVAERIK